MLRYSRARSKAICNNFWGEMNPFGASSLCELWTMGFWSFPLIPLTAAVSPSCKSHRGRKRDQANSPFCALPLFDNVIKYYVLITSYHIEHSLQTLGASVCPGLTEIAGTSRVGWVKFGSPTHLLVFKVKSRISSLHWWHWIKQA